MANLESTVIEGAWIAACVQWTLEDCGDTSVISTYSCFNAGPIQIFHWLSWFSWSSCSQSFPRSLAHISNLRSAISVFSGICNSRLLSHRPAQCDSHSSVHFYPHAFFMIYRWGRHFRQLIIFRNRALVLVFSSEKKFWVSKLLRWQSSGTIWHDRPNTRRQTKKEDFMICRAENRRFPMVTLRFLVEPVHAFPLKKLSRSRRVLGLGLDLPPNCDCRTFQPRDFTENSIW
jgi:hypothetical protein